MVSLPIGRHDKNLLRDICPTPCVFQRDEYQYCGTFWIDNSDIQDSPYPTDWDRAGKSGINVEEEFRKKMTSNCPSCLSTKTQSSRWRWYELPFWLLSARPIRCRTCYRRNITWSWSRIDNTQSSRA
jgi:hypothetical protein